MSTKTKNTTTEFKPISYKIYYNGIFGGYADYVDMLGVGGWRIYSRDLKVLYTGETFEDCEANIHLFESWCEENLNEEQSDE